MQLTKVCGVSFGDLKNTQKSGKSLLFASTLDLRSFRCWRQREWKSIRERSQRRSSGTFQTTSSSRKLKSQDQVSFLFQEPFRKKPNKLSEKCRWIILDPEYQSFSMKLLRQCWFVSYLNLFCKCFRWDFVSQASSTSTWRGRLCPNCWASCWLMASHHPHWPPGKGFVSTTTFIFLFIRSAQGRGGAKPHFFVVFVVIWSVQCCLCGSGGGRFLLPQHCQRDARGSPALHHHRGQHEPTLWVSGPRRSQVSQPWAGVVSYLLQSLLSRLIK